MYSQQYPPGDVPANTLPSDIHEQLQALEREYREGDITQKGYEKRRAALLASAGHAANHGSNGGGALDWSASIASMPSDYRQAHPPTRHMTAPLERPSQASSSHHPLSPYHHHPSTNPYQQRSPPPPSAVTSHSSGHYSSASPSAGGHLQPSPSIDGPMRHQPPPPPPNRPDYLSDPLASGYGGHNGAATATCGANGGPMGPRPNPMLRADGTNIPSGGNNYQALAPRSASPHPVTSPGGVSGGYQTPWLHRRTPSNGSMRSISSVRTLDPAALSRTTSSEYRGGGNMGPLPPIPQPPYMNNAYQHGRASLDQPRHGPSMSRPGTVHSGYPSQPQHSQYPPTNGGNYGHPPSSPHQYAGHPPPPPPHQYQHPPPHQQSYGGYTPPNPHYSQVHHRMDSASSATTFNSMSHFSRNGPSSHGKHII